MYINTSRGEFYFKTYKYFHLELVTLFIVI